VLAAHSPCTGGGEGCAKFQALGPLGIIFLPLSCALSLIVVVLALLPVAFILQSLHKLTPLRFSVGAAIMAVPTLLVAHSIDNKGQLPEPLALSYYLLHFVVWLVSMSIFFWKAAVRSK
jgi:hypothetical protein